MMLMRNDPAIGFLAQPDRQAKARFRVSHLWLNVRVVPIADFRLHEHPSPLARSVEGFLDHDCKAATCPQEVIDDQ
jgi:hypothetical protein